MTYGVGVSLIQMRDPAAAAARVPLTQEGTRDEDRVFPRLKFGNGAMVAEEFNNQMAAKGVTVGVQHIREARPERLPTADLYVFSSPGRMGRRP